MKDALISLAIYFVLFSVVLFFAYLVDTNKRKKKKKETIIFGLLVVIIPCIFAGMRADSVGTDIRVYAKTVFEYVLHSGSILETQQVYNVELGYVTLAYVCSKISSSLSFFLFATELLIVVPVYCVAYKRSKKCSVWFTMLVYLLVLYCSTFNIMRQSIAASFLLLSYQFFEEKKLKKSIIFAVIACFFHNSTIVGIAMYLVAKFIGQIKNKVKQGFITLFASLVILIVSVYWYDFSMFFIKKGLISDKFLFYVEIFRQSEVSSSYMFIISRGNYVELIFRILFVLLSFILIYLNKKTSKSPEVNFYMFLIFISELIYALVFVVFHSSYGLRIIWFGEWILLLLFPSLSYSEEKSTDGNTKTISTNLMIILIICVLYFSIGFVGLGWHGVKPLRFRF